jgi:DNA-binding MarR family transcriptional regulator
MDAIFELIGRLHDRCQQAARVLGLQPPTAMALGQIDAAISMSALAGRLGCERSFVTAIADELEGKGLARREADQRDRRVKNLTLTRRGHTVRNRLDQELGGHLPWLHALSDSERATFLALLNKLLQVSPGDNPAGSPGSAAGVR